MYGVSGSQNTNVVVEKHYDDDCSDALISPLTKGIFFHFLSVIHRTLYFVSITLSLSSTTEEKENYFWLLYEIESISFRNSSHLKLNEMWVVEVA